MRFVCNQCGESIETNKEIQDTACIFCNGGQFIRELKMSKFPWRIDILNKNGKAKNKYILDADGYVVANFYMGAKNDNAEFIVETCNKYYEELSLNKEGCNLITDRVSQRESNFQEV